MCPSLKPARREHYGDPYRMTDSATAPCEGNDVSESSDLVSVIIPAYNASRYIKETLDSVFAQTYPHYEIIVVNDGSPDTLELEQVLAPYRDRVTYIVQENRGPSGARNTGLRAAMGAFVALLDGDDVWLPTYLQEQVGFLRTHPEYDLCYCNAGIIGDSIFAGKDYMSAFPSSGEATAMAIITRRCYPWVNVLARKEALSVVAFDESLRFCEDFDCWIRFSNAGHRIGYQHTVLGLCRRHNESQSSNRIVMTQYKIRVLTKALGLWAAASDEARLIEHERERVVALLDLMLAKRALGSGETETAREHFTAANKFFKSFKLSATVALLAISPRLVASAFRLRIALFPAFRSDVQ